jgi:hypothetical protein
VPRKQRLRHALDEVITDADLVASAEQVAADPPASTPAVDLTLPPPGGFPPPPWESAPPMAPPRANGQPAPSPANGSPAASPANGAPAAPGRVPGNIDAAALDAAPAPTPLAPVAVPDLPAAHVISQPASPPVAAIRVDAHAEPVPAARRRRRSASPLPPLPSPSDIPEDAPGRIAILSMGPPPGTEPDPSRALAGLAEATLTTREPTMRAEADPPLAGWLPVLALGVALVLVFIVGVLVTR